MVSVLSSIQNSSYVCTALENVSSCLRTVQAEYRSVQALMQQGIVIPPVPSWNAIATPEVFVNTGAERFTQEIQSACSALSGMYARQQQISAQVHRMRSIPPGMLNDVAGVANRIQMLGGQVERLNSIPVSLRTDQVNDDLETLRGHLYQAQRLQDGLNDAVGSMDISEINAGYQQLNNTLDMAERNMRNLNNAQPESGGFIQQGSLEPLGDKMMSMAGDLVSPESFQKLLDMSDIYAQTSARLEKVKGQLGGVDDLHNQIFASAQRSGTSYMDTAEVVSRLAAETGNTFKSTDEAIVFAENMSKMFQMAGASQEEQKAASLQMVEALGNSVLSGADMNEVLSAAPGILDIMSDYLGVGVEDVRSMASEGKLTGEILKNSLLAATEDINSQFEDTPKTWSQVWTTTMNKLEFAMQPVLEIIRLLIDNWSILEPFVLAAAAAIGLYVIAMAIMNGLQLANAVIAGIQTAFNGGLTASTGALTGAQTSLNAALFACPITWIILAIIILIAILYSAVAAYNDMNETSVSATGIISGAFMACMALIGNKLIFVWNLFTDFANFVRNAMDGTTGSVKIAFYDMAITILGYFETIGKGIETLVNSIPGMNIDITSPLSNLKGKLENDVGELKVESGWVEYFQKIEYVDVVKTAKKGYDWGSELEAGAGNLLITIDESMNQMDGIYENTGDTASNTAAMSDTMNMADEELKSLRDMAELEAINRFTTAELSVNMGGITNQVNSNMDLDGIGRYLDESINGVLAAAAEGVY